MHPLHDDRGQSADRSEEGRQMGTPSLRQRGVVVNETEVDVFLEFLVFSMIHQMLAIWSLVALWFLNQA